MGQTQGKVDGDAQAQLMEVQRNYVNVRMEDVDFSNPTAVDDDDDDDDEEAGGQGDEAQTVEEDVRYEAYTPRVVKIKGMKRHPSDAVENGTLATVAPPAVTYALKLAEERPKVVKEGRLSDLQLEFVTYACQRHDEDLASGARCGFFLGDGAGMGKGRQLAGLILENVLQGRKKHIWVSTNIDLHEDAARDLGDVGVDEVSVFQLPAQQKTVIKQDAGVLFCTYSGLSKGCSAKSIERGTPARLDQIVAWCGGEDFDGCLLFDEAHRAKNLISEVPGTETAAGKAVFEIQRLLPRARVVYCSATAVSEPRNYGYMTRLGLWGPRSPFPTCEEDGDENSMHAVKNFIKLAELRGVGAMEMCALHLKREGALLCRTLSYTGAAFDVVEATLSPEQIAQYDKAAQLWQILHTRCESKLAKMATIAEHSEDEDGSLARAYREARQSYHSSLWGGHQRFFRSLITGFKVPTLVKLAKTALDDGKCVVIGLQSTGEAHAKRNEERKQAALNGDEQDDDLPAAGSDMLSAPQETLRYVVQKIWGEELGRVKASMASKKAAAAEAAKAPAKAHDDGLSDSDDDDDWLKSSKSSSKKQPLKVKNRESPPDKKKRKTESSEKAADDDVWGFDDSQESEEEMDLCDDDDGGGRTGDDAAAKLLADGVGWIEGFLERVDALDLPGNALDVILEELGNFDGVAEMSGRSSRVVKNWKGEYIYQKRTENGVSMDEQNIYEREEFQAGRKLVAIISDAASSGISLHAENAARVKNQRRRVHITLELPWSADKTIQQMGRSHRSNQVSAPEYKLLVSPLGGERRFCAAVVKRLESLGALTQGDRRASSVTKGWGCFNVDTKEGLQAVLDIFGHSNNQCNHMLTIGSLDTQKPLVPPPKLPLGEREALAKVSVDHAEAVGAPRGWEDSHGGQIVDKINLLHAAKLWLSLVGINVNDYREGQYTGTVAKFLNRILGLEVSRQQYLFDYFARYLEKTIKAAIRDGEYQKGITTFQGRSVAFVSESVVGGVPTPSAHDLVMHDIAVDIGTDFEAALAILNESRSTAKDQAVDIDDDDDDDAGRRASGSHGWMSTRRGGALRVTNVSGGPTGFRSPTLDGDGGERFGDRDGFRVLPERQWKKGGICLVIEVGEASMRGLSVKTDKFIVYRPDRIKEQMQWRGQVRSGEPKTDAQAKKLWTAAFNARERGLKERLLTGPVLHIYPQIIQAQCLLDTYNRNEVRIAKAEERDENGKKSGRVQIGVIVDFKKCKPFIKALQDIVCDEDSERAQMLQRESQTYQERDRERRAFAASERMKQ